MEYLAILHSVQKHSDLWQIEYEKQTNKQKLSTNLQSAYIFIINVGSMLSVLVNVPQCIAVLCILKWLIDASYS